jgi:hypothetical protein
VALFERRERECGAIAKGLWRDGGELDVVDVMVGPCKRRPIALSRPNAC